MINLIVDQGLQFQRRDPEPALHGASPVNGRVPHPAFPGLFRRHYRVLLADPPWKMVMGTKGRPQHYNRLSDDELIKFPVAELAHPEGCLLLLWVTSPMLERAPAVARAWGFKYSGNGFTWIKQTADLDDFTLGLGLTTRKNTEDCLLFNMGDLDKCLLFKRGRKGCRRHTGVPELMFAPRREHSRKPDETYARAEALAYPGPRAELFARQSWPGWDRWGLEVGKFDTA